MKASCQWVAFSAEPTGEDGELGWVHPRSCGPSELGGSGTGHRGHAGTRNSPRGAGSPAGPSLDRKSGCSPLRPRVFWGSLCAAAGLWVAGDLPPCLLLQVCWASCRWRARMEARGPCLSSAATQVSRAAAEPKPFRALLRRALRWGTEGSGATSCLHRRHLAPRGCAGGLRSCFSALGSPRAVCVLGEGLLESPGTTARRQGDSAPVRGRDLLSSEPWRL